MNIWGYVFDFAICAFFNPAWMIFGTIAKHDHPEMKKDVNITVFIVASVFMISAGYFMYHDLSLSTLYVFSVIFCIVLTLIIKARHEAYDRVLSQRATFRFPKTKLTYEQAKDVLERLETEFTNGAITENEYLQFEYDIKLRCPSFETERYIEEQLSLDKETADVCLSYLEQLCDLNILSYDEEVRFQDRIYKAIPKPQDKECLDKEV